MPPRVTELRPIVTLSGEAVAPGLANGTAFVYRDVLQRDSETYLIEPDQIDDEEDRVTTALEQGSKGLLIDAKQIEEKFGHGSAEIFFAQESMLRDPMRKDHLREILHEELVNAEQVVRIVFRCFARTFRDMADEVFRAGGDDVDDLSHRLLLSLGGIHAHSLENLPKHTVLVARRLLPSDTVFLSRVSTVGVVGEFAGPAAHAALLASAMGIPCVDGIPDLLERVRNGDDILVDGSEGTVIINPNDEYLEQFIGIQDPRDSHKKERIRASRRNRTATSDGREVPVMANVRRLKTWNSPCGLALTGSAVSDRAIFPGNETLSFRTGLRNISSSFSRASSRPSDPHPATRYWSRRKPCLPESSDRTRSISWPAGDPRIASIPRSARGAT